MSRAKTFHVQGATHTKVEEYLRSEQAYTLHKPSRRRYNRNYIYVAGIDAKWQDDVADMQSIAKHNGGIRY